MNCPPSTTALTHTSTIHPIEEPRQQHQDLPAHSGPLRQPASTSTDRTGLEPAPPSPGTRFAGSPTGQVPRRRTHRPIPGPGSPAPESARRRHRRCRARPPAPKPAPEPQPERAPSAEHARCNRCPRPAPPPCGAGGCRPGPRNPEPAMATAVPGQTHRRAPGHLQPQRRHHHRDQHTHPTPAQQRQHRHPGHGPRSQRPAQPCEQPAAPSPPPPDPPRAPKNPPRPHQRSPRSPQPPR